MNKEKDLEIMRHSLSHVMAAAVKSLWPKVKFAIGPAIENGFYYDFDFGKEKVSEEDLKKIEKKMEEIIKRDLKFEKSEMKINEAIEREKKSGQIYKMELIEDLKKEDERKVSYYRLGEFEDLCRGPHVAASGKLKNAGFKLTKLAGAYWRGDEKRPMLTRIYAVAFASKKELEDYLKMVEEAEKRDHRKIGQDLKLFVFSDLVGKGLPTFGPKGAVIKRELERFAVDEEIKRGYHHVVTPDLAKVDLYKKSGHYPYYKDTMYPVMKIDEEELILRPMTCPHHFMFYKSEPHSYRDLPYRIAEIAHQYRYEKSGELSGLTRVRMFCLADAHIICAKEQAKQVIREVLELIDFANQTFGMVKGVDYRYRLSLGDRKDDKKYYKDDASWKYAENVLREVLKDVKAPFFEADNEAAFYGPKIDIQVKKANGQEETAFTVQYDFVMAERFELTFTNKEGKDERPIVIHRSSIGCLERTIAFLIERYAGAFPVWLSPVQVKIISVGESHIEFCQKLAGDFRGEDIRVEVDESNETVGNKIRKAVGEKAPYILVVGDKEMGSKKLAVRDRGSRETREIEKDKFIAEIREKVRSKK
ncbi:MAG: threonine--tRNA ligase [Patescibacteria group bacterium]|nr:threonine--tRNA ligase [Patescibacteria group bacterium]